jgi:hypothetical protein
MKHWHHQQLDKSFSEGFPGLFGFFLASAFFEAFFSLLFVLFQGFQWLRPFRGFFSFGLFAFSEPSCNLPLSMDFLALLKLSTASNVFAPISSSHEMERKACAWAVGDDTYTVANASVLPTFLQHLLEGDLSGFQAELCDLTSPDSDLALEWNVDVNIISQRDKKLYLIRPRGSEAPGPSILLESTAAVLQIIRSGWWHDFAHLICELVGFGTEFHPSWERPANHVPLAPPSINTLGRRPAGYKPTFVDVGVYVQRWDTFLRLPRSRAALFYGGIVGQLARLAIPDFEDIACLDPSEDILKTGAHMLSRNGEEALWHEALMPDEINLICGVYSVETGTFI